MKSPGTEEPEFEFVIVGTGFSGLGMAIELKNAKRHSFVVLEKASEVGGTWRDNHYPGCACDVPSHLYSFSFEQNPRWSRMFAPQREIFEYLDHCAKKYDILPHIRFHAELTRAEYDEQGAHWRVQLRSGEIITARYLVFATGPLSRPAYPEIRGLERFKGKSFHSATWDHDYDLEGKDVAVIGTGASAIQFVPQIAPQVRKLHLFQRTPPWVIPKPDRSISSLEQRLFEAAPLTQRAYRAWIYWQMEMRAFGFTLKPEVMKLVERWGAHHIKKQISDERLRKAVMPSYRAGCKRILMADDYYPALARPNVEVITEGISEVTERGIVASDGVERDVDAIIYGTGFRVTDLLTPIEVIGRGGVDINDAWADGMEAYLGTMISGFPNFFMMLGPNTGLGHNSMVFMIEAQVHYVLECVRAMEARGSKSMDVRPRAQTAFNEGLHLRLSRAVWASGCRSWYLDAQGRNRTLWPGFTVEFWARTRRPTIEDYAFDAASFPWEERARRTASPSGHGRALGALRVGGNDVG